MPNPKTIEELLKMDAYPFRDKQIVSADDWKLALDNKRLGFLKEHNKDRYAGFEFVMPANGYYLPPDKQLGLPLGKWTWAELQEFLESLPYGVVTQYFYDPNFAYVKYEATWHYPEEIKSLRGDQINEVCYPETKIIYVVKQPPNLYCPPINQQAEEVPAEGFMATSTKPIKHNQQRKAKQWNYRGRILARTSVVGGWEVYLLGTADMKR